MFERIKTIAEGHSVRESSPSEASRVSPSHLNWIERLLSESPASLQDISLGESREGKLTLEWQSVFQGVGTAYFRTDRGIIAICLLLHGRFPASERAAIEAVHQAVQSVRTRSGSFDLVRKHSGRPLQAIILMDDASGLETQALTEYWSDCLALAYFSLLAVSFPESDIAASALPRATAV